jgi:GGDEF domain-containing protein
VGAEAGPDTASFRNRATSMAISFELRIGEAPPPSVHRTASAIPLGETIEAQRPPALARAVAGLRHHPAWAGLASAARQVWARVRPEADTWRRLVQGCAEARDRGAVEGAILAAAARFAPAGRFEIRLGRCAAGMPDGHPADGRLDVPILAQGAPVGVLSCRFPLGAPTRPALRRRLQTLGRVAGLLLRTPAPTAESTRERILPIPTHDWPRDPVTGLPGVDYLEAHLQRLLRATPRPRVALLIVAPGPLDRVREELGTELADAAAALVARVVVRSVRAGDPVVRLPGDRFALALAGVTPDDARRVASAVRRAVAEAGITGSTPCPLTAEVHVLPVPDDPAGLDALLTTLGRAHTPARGTSTLSWRGGEAAPRGAAIGLDTAARTG